MNNRELPLPLARQIAASFFIALVGVPALAVALRLGLADPRPQGHLQWEDEFNDLSRWSQVEESNHLVERDTDSGGLRLSLGNGAPAGTLLATVPDGAYTIELAATQPNGETSLRHGLVLGWRDAEHYTAVLVNRDGYAEAYTRDGNVRIEWFPWQQWPHLLVGGAPNRLRADVRADGTVEVRLNDEWLVAFRAAGSGRAGPRVEAPGGEEGVALFYFIRLWSSG